MLIAIMIMFLGGGAFSSSIVTTADIDRLSKQIQVVVTDPERAGKSKQILAELKAEVKNFDAVFVDTGKIMRELYQDHASDSAQMRAAFDTLNGEWYDAQQRGIALRSRLRETLAAAEWRSLFSAE